MKPKQTKPKIIVILGQTATGKSDLGVYLAKKFNGEIISADSRQVYKGLDLGSGKITKTEMKGVPHYLLDVISPKKVFSVKDFKYLAEEKIDEILNKEKVPIIVGGTGFYIQSIVDGIELPEIEADEKLRKTLSEKSLEELQKIFRKLNKNNTYKIDENNRARLTRAIEILKTVGKIPSLQKKPKFESLQIGLYLTNEKLKEKIHTRIMKRIKQGMIKEVKSLHEKGLSWKRLHSFGLEYRYLSLFLKKEISKPEMIEQLENKIFQFSKRQMTWFKRDKRIKWFLPGENQKIEKEIEKFL